jgi:hypothetical protein
MADDDHNPYAPPAEALVAFRDAPLDDGPNDFESERRPVILTIVLTVVTLGFYSPIWLLRRRAFLDRQDSDKADLGTGLPMLILVASVMGVGLALAGSEAAKIRPLFSLLSGVATIIANFRVLGILRSVSARTGRFIEFSTVGTFFFGIYYLQYKINQMADTPARAERPRRKKKRKKLEARATAEADADAELRAEEEARRLGADEPQPPPAP